MARVKDLPQIEIPPEDFGLFGDSAGTGPKIVLFSDLVAAVAAVVTEGATGPAGPAGTGYRIRGTVSGGVWVDPVSPAIGDTWIAGGAITGITGPPGGTAAAGDGLQFNGVNWTNTGQLRGPVGPTGLTGPIGPVGPVGATGATGAPGSSVTDYTAVKVLDNFAALIALGAASTTAGQVTKGVVLRSYSQVGIGSGTWLYNSTSTRTGPFFAPVAAGGCYEPVFPGGEIDPQMAGGIPMVTSDAAVQAAVALHQDITWPSSCIRMYEETQITTTIQQIVQGSAANYRLNGAASIGQSVLTIDSGTGTWNAGQIVNFQGNRNYRYRVVSGTTTSLTIDPPLKQAVADNASILSGIPRLHVRGASRERSHTIGAVLFQSGSVVRMMANDRPVFILADAEGSLVGIGIEYETKQTSANPLSCAITMRPGTDLLHWRMSNLAIRGAAYGLYFPHTPTGFSSSAGSIANARFDHVWVSDYGITGAHIGASGTPIVFSGLYIQNNPRAGGVNITSYSRTLDVLTVITPTLPASVQKGSMVQTIGFATDYDNQFIVEDITGSGPYTVTVRFRLDQIPAAPAAGLTGGQLFSVAAELSTGPGLYVGPSTMLEVHGLDCEATHQAGDSKVFAVEVDGFLVCTSWHVEYYAQLGAGTDGRIFECNPNGSIQLGPGTVTNIGLGVGKTMTLFSNRSRKAFTVERVHIRDVSSFGTFTLARRDKGCTPVKIGHYELDDTVRMNAQSEWDIGDAVTNLTGTYHNKDVSNRPRLICAGSTVLYGVEDGNVSGTQTTGKIFYYLPRPVDNLSLVFSGIKCRSTFTLPAEIGMGNDYEVNATIQRVGADLTTFSGTRVGVTFHGNKAVGRVKNGTLLESDFCGSWDAGWICVRTFAHVLVSSGLAVATDGETGTITSAGTFTPRNNNQGGSLGRDGLAGQNSSNLTTLDAATWNKADITSITITSTGGPGPCAMFGEFADGGSKIRPVAIVGDSISRGVGDSPVATIRLSGLGYATQALMEEFPGVNLSQGGNDIEYWLLNQNEQWRSRSWLLAGCEVILLNLGTNGLAAGATAATQIAHLKQFIKEQRRSGSKRKIVYCSVLTRATSTDGWETLGNQTPVAGFFAKATEVNDWALSSDADIDGFIDFRPAMEDGTGKFLAPGTAALATVISGTPTGTGGSGNMTIPLAENLTAAQYQGYGLVIGGAVKTITSHTTGAGASILTVPAFASLPTNGTACRIIRNKVIDSAHPSPMGHKDMRDVLYANRALLYCRP